jgi:hypothetical protein
MYYSRKPRARLPTTHSNPTRFSRARPFFQHPHTITVFSTYKFKDFHGNIFTVKKNGVLVSFLREIDGLIPCKIVCGVAHEHGIPDNS